MVNEGDAKRIFLEGIGLDPSARSGFLNRACKGNADLRRRVDCLLAAHERGGTDPWRDEVVPLNEAGRGATGATASRRSLAESIGQYRILRKIGEGGMGSVFLAEQLEPIRRLVALKLIKFGMHTDEVVARFESERQALALMNHPSIAQVLDASATDTGRPYFVMEYVRGLPITEFCDSRELSIRERLQLFEQVCHAVQHAHQKGIIHRDIKPSNVLVTDEGQRMIPKVIDFGVAKATQQRLTERTLLTEHGQLIGTPEYMSPEQTEMSDVNVDTRTDIYSLGALLYQISTGSLPFESRAFRAAGLGDIQRIIREDDPPKPSTRLSSLGDRSRAVAAARRTDPRSLERLLRGDLDWIIMKALEKDCARRYASAAELATDVARHVNDEPVIAGPPSTVYRVRKFVRRNRAAVGAMMTVASVLVIATIVSVVFALRAGMEANRRMMAEQSALLQGYVAAIFAADLALKTSEITVFRKRLLAAPQDLRRWEWFYLRDRLDLSMTTLDGHENPVYSVAFSPDGTRLASASWDTTIRIWDVSSGRERLKLSAHEEPVHSVVFSPDGRSLASSSMDQTIRIWNLTTGREVTTLGGHTGTVVSVAYSPDGELLASGSRDGTVRLWDLSNDSDATVLVRYESEILCVAFSQDGALLAFGCGDGSIGIRDTATGERQVTPVGHTHNVFSLAFSPNGERLASASGDLTVRIWDAATGEEIASLKGHNQRVYSVAFSPNGTRVATASHDSTVRVWDPVTGDELHILRGHSDYVSSVAFSPDGTRIASGSGDQTIKFWSPSPQDGSLVLDDDERVHGVAFSRNGNRLVSVSDSAVRLWSLSTSEEMAIFRPPGELRSAAFSPRGVPLAAGRNATGFAVWDVSTGEQMINISDDADEGSSSAFSSDGTRLAYWSGDDPIEIWDVLAARQINVLRGGSGDVYSTAFSPDGTRLVSASYDSTIRIWDTTTGEELSMLSGHSSAVSCVVFFSDGRRLASGSLDNDVRIWDLSKGETTARLAGHVNYVNSLTLSPDGTRLASASSDTTIKIWDTSTGEELITLRGHQATVQAVAFSPDGTRLASGAYDKTIRIWGPGSPR